MKKNLQEGKEGNQPEEKPSKTEPDAAGKVLRYIVYAVIILVIAGIIYYLTRYTNSTFKINNL